MEGRGLCDGRGRMGWGQFEALLMDALYTHQVKRLTTLTKVWLGHTFDHKPPFICTANRLTICTAKCVTSSARRFITWFGMNPRPGTLKRQTSVPALNSLLSPLSPMAQTRGPAASRPAAVPHWHPGEAG